MADEAVGYDGRIVCILKAKQIRQDCSPLTAEVYIRGVGPNAVSTDWVSDREVQIRVAHGRVKRFKPTAIDNSITVTLLQGPFNSMRIEVLNKGASKP